MNLPSLHRIRRLASSFLAATLNSYSLVFFSHNRVFALILLGVSFFDLNAGLSGLVAVIVSNALAWFTGFNRAGIRAGYYGFNSLLVGMGIGIYYQPGAAFFALLLFASLLALFLTVTTEGFIGKYGLPFLSISFLLTIWLVSLAARQFTALLVSERGIYMMNEMFGIGDMSMVKTYTWFYDLRLPEVLKLYFRSLGAIFFQYYALAGILVAIGLIIYSRIAFLLSLVGFFSAYLYYLFIGADLHELSAGYIGFNFILTAIAIGGFFVIPSKHSFLWVLLMTPLVSVMLTGFHALFSQLQLSVFSLPFNLIVIMFLYVMKFRERYTTKPEMVIYQHFSPEENLYALLNHRDRFGKTQPFPVSLPFLGTWKVTQGHDGEPTHKGEWKHGLDFEVTDEEGGTWSGKGTKVEDYYAFGKPVTAPADGVVEELVDGVEDNIPGQTNLTENWGNAIVIRHAPHLFTKMTHLKKGSLKVSKGDRVRQGDLLGLCGNSGRSPFPHLHFQVQATPFIGSKTICHPLSHYLTHEKGPFRLHSFEVPKEGEEVANIEPNEVLDKGFRLIPGQKLELRVITGNGDEMPLAWEVQADALNYTYLYCPATGSRAWFTFTGRIHSFTYFEGDKRSVLFRFFLGAYKIVTGFYPGLEITDRYPVNLISNRVLLTIQDFVAPFLCFLSARFQLRYVYFSNDILNPEVGLESSSEKMTWNRKRTKARFGFKLSKRGLETFTFTEKNKTTQVVFLHGEGI
jgi:urea transporter/murein DD-endopeptidase MepM/ murein hydrolase activator NlpD